MTIQVALAGAGAFGIKHLDAIQLIEGVQCVSLIGRDLDKTHEVAARYGIPHVATNLADSLALPGLDAVILCTPTQLHAAQSLACLRAVSYTHLDVYKRQNCWLTTRCASIGPREHEPPGLSLRAFATPRGGSCSGPAEPVPRKSLIGST